MPKHPITRRNVNRVRTRHTVRASCSRSVSRQIRKERTTGKRRTRDQDVAISFSKVRRKRPECRRFIRKGKNG